MRVAPEQNSDAPDHSLAEGGEREKNLFSYYSLRQLRRILKLVDEHRGWIEEDADAKRRATVSRRRPQG